MEKVRSAVDLLRGVSVWGKTLDPVVPFYIGQRVLVTGACGTIGSGVLRALLEAGVDVTGVDWDENAVAKAEYPIVLADFVDFEEYDYDYVIHCAAYKHAVFRHEKSKKSYYHNNYRKVAYWLLQYYMANHEGRFVLCSTDKAAGKSVMGQSKRMCESEVVSRGYTAVRLVNVVGSRGSVIDKWNQGGPYKLCPREVRRYWMQLTDAVYALLRAGLMRPRLYSVWNCPSFSMGEMWDAWNVGKHQYEEIPLGEEEAIEENLIRDGEVLWGDDEELREIHPNNLRDSVL